ncbi:hypothetical protein [Enterococcus casseliflavus]|uniref:hypothetical protein n=1 Tax=Enterococcus casseliflavus TaxID=37734 RepID=UPI00115EB169|nr:hypothetical protein [Enterococcus casseliflavus]
MVQIPILNKKISLNDFKDNIKIYESDIVYLGGSLIEGSINKISSGMGNVFSDIDLFIIRDSNYYIETDYEYDFQGVKSFFTNIQNMNIDIEVYDVKEVYKIINSINNINFNDNKRTENILDTTMSLFDVNSFLCRLFNSIPLKNISVYSDLKKSIYSDNFFDLYENHIINNIENSIEDIEGNIISEQYNVSLYAVRSAFLEYSKIYIMDYKEYIDRDKWVFLKMLNLSKENHDETISEFYNKLFCSDVSSDIDKKIVIDETLSYIRKQIELKAFDNLII